MLHAVKSKFSKRLTKEQEKRMKQACSMAVSGLQTTLSIAKDVTGVAGVPGLQAGISSLLVAIDAIKKTDQNAEDVEKLANQIAGLNTFLSNVKIGRPLPPAVADRIGHLASTLSKVSEETKVMASRGVIRRLIHHGDDIQVISGQIQTATWAIQSFTVESTLAIEFALDEISMTFKEHANRMQENFDHVHDGIQKLSVKLDAKDGHPPCALFAGFDRNADRTRCCEGTRKDVLDQIFQWIDIEDTLDDATGASMDTRMNSRIFWINGSAGTGKSTIAYTVAEECRKRGILGASFFCSRDDAECSNPGLIFTTIAYQLGIFSPLFKAEVSRIVASDPGIGYASIPYQLEQLIINPLLSLGGSIRPCVVVVDALDECRESGITSVILSSLSRYVNQLSPIKFLVTSRPESRITTTFKDRELGSAPQKLILHEVRLDIVAADITRYLSSRLALTRISREIQCEWPTMEDVRKLAQLSHGLFIFAATSIRFIEDPSSVDARGQLESLLRNTPLEHEDPSPHFHLYRLYTQVLDRAFPVISSTASGRLKMVLGSISLIRQPLSPSALDHLLGLKSSTVRETLVNLHSVVIVPDDDTSMIRLLHPSFFDFITSPLRCRNPKFVVDPEIQHTLLARACLQAMKGLRQDICGIRNPSILNSEVDDLSTRITSNIPSHMQYACSHWASHLASASFSEVLVDLIKEFCVEKILNWLEVCSLLGELRNALLALNTVQQTITKSGWNIPDTLNLLRDCERFTLEFFPIISSCTLQLYRSALLLTPKQAIIRKPYEEWLDCALKIYNAPDETWSPCLRTMEGHTNWVNSVAFSPDGSLIVSGSNDKTLRLWDAVSGAHFATLRGHSDQVKSVAFSPDGTRIVSGSGDATVRLWDTVSGARIATLRGHSDQVTSVAFSPDGTRIVSGSEDMTLRLWDAVSGSHRATLSGHSKEVTSVAFSLDDIYIVSGSMDKTLRLWYAVSGAHTHTFTTLHGHSDTVSSVAFSPDGTHVVSASWDCTIRLWVTVSGAHIATLSERFVSVQSVAFSPDGIRIVSGSGDTTVRMWDTVSGARIATLRGHSNQVTSVAFSPDGTRIVSGSDDNTLRLWDAVGGTHRATVSKHSNAVASVVFSPDGSRIASRSFDAIHLWDTVSGANFTTLSGRFKWVRSVAFSPDGTRIVSGSSDTTVRLWDTISGARIATLCGHSRWVNSVAFSPDGTRIVSGSEDKTLRLWDAVSGSHRSTLCGHSNLVTSVAFSPDGTHIVSGSRDTTLRLWDVDSGSHLATLSGHSQSVESVSFSPDGTRIVSGSHDTTIRLWDAVSGAHFATLRKHPTLVTSVAFSPDGTRIVSGSHDGTLHVWDTASGQHLDSVRGHRMCAPSLAHSLSSSWTSFSQRGTIPSGSVCSIFSYLTEDGWIRSIPLNRRICWIPVMFRQHALGVTKDRVAFGLVDGRVVILHFKDMDKFFRDLS